MTERVVITGANRGLGLELARHFCSRGDEVWAGCRRPAGASALRELTDHVHRLDMASEASIDRFAAEVGTGPIDVLVNNAGVHSRSFGVSDDELDVLRLSAEHFFGELRINAVGPMLLVRALLGPLRQAERPRIVNMSSQVGSLTIAQTIRRDVGYAASKATLNMITVKLAWRLRDEGITAVSLHPGFLRTDMNHGRGDMDPADAAKAIVALVDQLTLADSGNFLRWDGTTHPW